MALIYSIHIIPGETVINGNAVVAQFLLCTNFC